MLVSLIKKQLLELFSSYVVDRKTGKARNKNGIILYIVLAIILFGGLGFAFYTMAGGLGAAILGHGFNWLYFALMGLLSIALGIFGSVFNTYASLYLPKDNEFLISLPIPSYKLVLARTAGVFFISLMYSAWLWIPAIIAYWVLTPVSVLGVVFPILLTFVIALFVSVLSCILGWIVAVIASKAKGKSFLTVFLSLLVIVLYYVIYFKVVNSLGEILDHIDSLGTTVKTWLHYVYLLGLAADGNVLPMLGIVGITVLLAALCLFALVKTFTKLALTTEKTEKNAKKIIGYKKHSVEKALLNRELRHFTSMSTWMLNGGLGLLIMPAAAITAIIKADFIRDLIAGGASEFQPFINAAPVLLIAIIGMIVSTNCMLPCSISLEGNTLWILRTLPVEPWEILHAKENMGVALNIYPTVFTALVLGIVFQLEIIQIVLLVCSLWLLVWLMQDFGLFLNLLHPDFNWTNPNNVVKQGLPVFIYLFGGWIFCGLTALGGYYLCKAAGVYVSMVAVAALFGILFAILHRWLRTKGTAILSTM